MTVSYRETTTEELEKFGVVQEFGDNAWGDFAHHGEPYLILCDGHPAGWFQLSDAGLQVIEIIPEMQRKGIASEIIRQLYGDSPPESELTATPASQAGARLLRRFGVEPLETYMNETAQEIVEALLEGKPDLDKLKKHRQALTPQETAAFNGVKLESPGDGASKLKAVIDGETWYAVYTHRACHIDKTLKGVLSRLPFIASTA